MQLNKKFVSSSLSSLFFLFFIVGCGGSSSTETPDDVPDPNPPQAVADMATVERNQEITISVMDNDIDVSHSSITELTQPSNGTAVITGNTIVYTPNSEFSGVDLLTYTLEDSHNQTSQAEVSIDVTTSLTLSGEVRTSTALAEGEVTINVDENDFTDTLDENGHYSITIVTTNPSQFVIAVAQGSGDSESVSLDSLVGSIEKLYLLSGEDKILTNDESKNVDINSISTSRAALVRTDISQQNDEGIKNKSSQTDELTDALIALAEKNLDVEELLQAAAIITLIADDPDFDLPEGVTSILELVADDTALTEYVAEVQETQPEALETAIEEVADNSLLFAGFTAAKVPEAYYTTLVGGYNYIQGWSFEFNADGTGDFTGPNTPDTFTWAIVEGVIEIILDNGSVNTSDRWDEEQQGYFTHTYTTSKWWIKLINEGEFADTITLEDEGFEEWLGVTTPWAAESPLGSVGIKPGGDIAFTESEVEGTWGGPYFSSSSISGGHSGSDIVVYNSDGTGSAQIANESFNWNVDIEGRLSLVYSNGDIMTYRRLRTDGIAFDTLVVRASVSGNKYAVAELMVKQDPELTLTEEYVSAEFDKYGYGDFSLVLNSDNSGHHKVPGVEQDSWSWSWRTFGWEIANNEIVINYYWQWDIDGPAAFCDVGAECSQYGTRVEHPLALDGDRLYAIETQTYYAFDPDSPEDRYMGAVDFQQVVSGFFVKSPIAEAKKSSKAKVYDRHNLRLKESWKPK